MSQRTLAARMEEGGFDGYAYSYPHKTAYRPLQPAVPLQQAWSGEDRRHLYLYVHLPFCEMRCGFCNLFTTVRPAQDLVERTLAALERQSQQVSAEVRPRGVAQGAVGGGTPSYLTEAQLERLFAVLRRDWPADWGVEAPLSLEVSPGTVTPAKLRLLKDLGVTRLSLGVQSFVAEDLEELRRPSLGSDVRQVCGWIREAGFAVFNLDLIYGNPGMTAERWERSLQEALRWQPEELYLYPLYVGKLTNLDRLGRRPGEFRRALYGQARDLLLAAGYRQISMRLFRRPGVSQDSDYCCQGDGMIGLGPGARSYTRDLHYSTEYAVGQPGVRAIIAAFTDADYRHAHYGVRLDSEEQKRRFVIKSLLRADGLDAASYRARFGSHAMGDLPQLQELLNLHLAALDADNLILNARGLAYSDTIGPWLYSELAGELMREYELR